MHNNLDYNSKDMALFFTRDISLENWIDSGLIDREKLIYEKHIEHKNLRKIYWFTYGCNDSKLGDMLKVKGGLNKGIEVVQMPKLFNFGKLGRLIYSFTVPVIHFKILKGVDVIKTNQMDGAWAAVISKILYRKKLFIRTGYNLSLFKSKQRKSFYKVLFFKLVEQIAYKYADFATVSSESARKNIIARGLISKDKIFTAYNYIETEKFYPIGNKNKSSNSIVFVGRIEAQKNLYSLITAIKGMSLSIDIYGQGSLENSLTNYAHVNNVKINFLGPVSNNELPRILSKYNYYILPSYEEGMPKTLLEAMACGLTCIGTNVDGINEVIINRVNGFLAYDTSPQAIKKAIVDAKSNDYEVKANASKTIKDKFTLESYELCEINLFKRLWT